LREALATVESLAKSYETESGTVEALHAVDAVVPAGATTAILGVSGSGKSTLLRLLAGIELPTAGRVLVGGAELARLDRAALRRYRREQVAYVSQRAADNLFPHLTVAEHAPDAPRELFAALGVAHRLDARADQLSGGELARAAFAVALARNVPLVIVDEPTAELDSASAETLLAAIGAATERGTTFVVATHDPGVLAITEHVVELERGRNAGAPVQVARPSPAGERPVVLRRDGLTLSYGSTRALDGASIELREGELAVVVGRSGSGKSTLLMLLGGWLGGGVPDPAWAEIAYVPQRFGLVPELTVFENVDLPARLGGVPSEADALLARLGLAELAGRYPAEISIGQQQRVAVARALCVRTRILLVDEPTSHQDAASAELVWAALGWAAERGTASLIATHEPDARRRAHASWSIENGHLQRDR
jgi:putative ABC transport system ATP-binding protein/macrolide transport system ATP-binding/permease protein